VIGSFLIRSAIRSARSWFVPMLGGLLAGLAALPAGAGVQEGVAALRQKDYATAAGELQAAAQAGDPVAQRYLGVMYAQGLGVAEDAPLGARWLIRSAAAGDLEALFNLGVAHYFGHGVGRDLETAAELFRAAAEQGHDAAAFNLAGMYKDGAGVPADRTAAAVWYAVAARRGEPEGFRQLALLRLEDDPGPGGRLVALVWLLLAEEAGAQGAAADAVELAAALTPRQRALARTLAGEWPSPPAAGGGPAAEPAR
jgi:hypothetical protein